MKAARLPIAAMALAILLNACGGGGGGSTTPAPPPDTGSAPPPAPAPDPSGATLVSGTLARMAVRGTSISMDVNVTTTFTPGSSMQVKAIDPQSVVAPTASLVPAGGSSYTVRLSTQAGAAAAHYKGTLILAFCNDSACTGSQLVASLEVPYDINVLTSATSADTWPGNNLTPLSAWADVPDWSMFQGNAAHTGFVPVTLNPDRFSTRWMTISPTDTAIATSNGRLYFGQGNIIHAKSEFDDSTVWDYDLRSLRYPSTNAPTVSGGVVYMAAGQQDSTFMFALDEASGTLNFKSTMSSQWEHYLSPTVGPHGVYTNAGAYGGLYGFDFTGQQLFFANSLLQTSMWTPAVDDTAVYAYTGTLNVLDPVTGAKLHSIADPTFTNYTYEIDGSPVLGASGKVFVANYANSRVFSSTNTLLAFDVSKDQIAWQMPGAYATTPAYDQGTVFATNKSPLRLEMRAEGNGTLLWSWTPPQAGETTFASEVLLTNNLIWVSTDMATYAIDRASHQTVWSYPVSGKLALSKNGILYIQGQSGLTAINLK